MKEVAKSLLIILPLIFVSCDALTDRTIKVNGKVTDAGTGIGISVPIATEQKWALRA